MNGIDRRDGSSSPEVSALTALPPEAVLKTESFEIITGRSNPELARSVGEILELGVDEPVTLFADGESRIQISPNLRRRDVYIIQPTSPPVNDSVMELLFMISAAIRASAQEVTAVVPYFGYARQDRKDRPRVTISGADVASMIKEAGAKRILTFDLHAEQMEGAAKIPWDNIYGSKVLLPAIQEETDKRNMVVVSPDVGGTKRAEKFSNLLGKTGGDIAIVHKRRQEAGMSEALAVVGDVDGKDALLVDDIIDTAGTMTNAARLLKNNGARSIRIAATHGLFTPPALDRIEDSPIDQVFVTDTIRLSDEVRSHPKIVVVTIAHLLAEAIRRMHTGEPVSELIPKAPEQ